jgi:hypothetical protein
MEKTSSLLNVSNLSNLLFPKQKQPAQMNEQAVYFNQQIISI